MGFLPFTRSIFPEGHRLLCQDLASKIQSSQGAETSRLVSQPLVVDFRDANGTVLEMGNLDRPLTLEMSAPGKLSGLACAFWNAGTASWSTDGMTLVGTTNNTRICETSHLSIFAIIEMVIEQSIQALDCSTAGQLLTQKAFRQLGANGDWIQHDAAVAIICMICLFCIFWWMACRQDWAAGRNLPRKTREAILFRLADERPDRDVGLKKNIHLQPPPPKKKTSRRRKKKQKLSGKTTAITVISS